MSFAESRFLNVEQAGPIVISASSDALASHPTIANTMAEALSVDGDTHLPELANEGPLRNPFHLERSDQGGWFVLSLVAVLTGGAGPDFDVHEADAAGTPPGGAEVVSATNLLGSHALEAGSPALLLQDHAGAKVFVPLTACGFLGDYATTMFTNDEANRDCLTALQGATNTRIDALEEQVAEALESNCDCVNAKLGLITAIVNHNVACLDSLLGPGWLGCRLVLDPEEIPCDCISVDPTDPIAIGCDPLVDPCEAEA